MFRFIVVSLTLSVLACSSGPPVTPEPGMQVIAHGRDGEFQAAIGVDWSSYTKVILHTAPVDFRKNWQRDKEREYKTRFREEDMEQFRTAVSGQFAKVMHKKLSDREGYELTSESGPGVMRFLPRIVDLDIAAPGWVQESIIESISNTRGSVTVELVIRDSVSDELLGVGWQRQSDPQEGYLETTNTVNNTVAFRLMMQNAVNWMFEQLAKAGAAER